MGTTFAEKFEEALEELREREPGYGVRTLARGLAKGDPKKMETIRRRLNKYRPKPGGGAADVAPTEPTRREIEEEMGLDVDALKPEEDLITALAPDPFDGGPEPTPASDLFNALEKYVEHKISTSVKERLGA